MFYLGYHKEFPRLFQPAFTLQINMARYIMGTRYWEKKKFHLEEIRREERLKLSKDKDSKALRARKANERKTRKRMGLMRYYCCPCFRYMFDGSVLPEVDPAVEDAKKKRAAEIAEAKRMAELRLKNPETQAWQKYKEKKEDQFAKGNTTFIEDSQEKQKKKRSERVENRQARRQRRADEESIKY
ncbi:unnamed protein product [Symbiodinium microadriaticum]|nr:unnamed protein product [Symbiodinium microadriaticum]